MSVTTFGVHEGERIDRVALSSRAGLTAAVIGFGVSLQDLCVPTPDGPRRVTLGFDALGGYVAHGAFFGAVVGRCGNRIGHGRLAVDGAIRQLDLNENGRHHLHGGRRGFGVRAWRLIDHGAAEATFELVSEDGEMGYPGRMIARARYRLDGLTLHVEMSAVTSAPTAVNLVAHPYFNLAGGGDVGRHVLRIDAAQTLDVDADLIPTGRLLGVEATARDFRRARTIDAAGGAYDDCYVVTPGAAQARLAAPDGAVTMTIDSDRPGLQFYDGRHIPPLVGLGGVGYGPRSGLCLEAQAFPDAPNHAAFPTTTLRPGETFRAFVSHRFEIRP